MSLVVSVDVNRVGTHLGLITIRRAHSGPQGLNTYWYEIHGKQGALIASGDVEHRFTDSPLTLLRKTLEAADV